MKKNLELSGMIHRKFPSEAACANAIGLSKQRLNRIVNGYTVPTLQEVGLLSDGLEEPFLKIAGFYLPEKSTNEQQ